MPLRLLSIILLVCCLSACGPSNAVRLLSYTPSSLVTLPQPGAPLVAVVLFEDQRANQNIGIRLDGSPFLADRLVTDWVSRALGQELSRLGYQVVYSSLITEARAANPPYLVTGTIDKIWIQEKSRTSFTSEIRLHVSLSQEDNLLFSEEMVSGQEKQDIPKASLVENLLNETLRDVLVNAAQKISIKIHQ